MQLNRRPTRIPEISVGSFADIAFLLIIFFILTTTLAIPAGRQVKMPAGTRDEAAKNAETLTISVSPGRIHYGKDPDPIDLSELRRRLAAENFPARPVEERVVIIDSSEDLPYQRYYEVVTAVSRAGAALGIIEEQEIATAGGGS